MSKELCKILKLEPVCGRSYYSGEMMPKIFQPQPSKPQKTSRKADTTKLDDSTTNVATNAATKATQSEEVKQEQDNLLQKTSLNKGPQKAPVISSLT